MEPLSQSEELLIKELFENSISSEKVRVSKLDYVEKLSEMSLQESIIDYFVEKIASSFVSIFLKILQKMILIF